MQPHCTNRTAAINRLADAHQRFSDLAATNPAVAGIEQFVRSVRPRTPDELHVVLDLVNAFAGQLELGLRDQLTVCGHLGRLADDQAEAMEGQR